MSAKRTRKPATKTVPLTMDADLAAKVDKAALETRLSKQAVMRMSIDRGLDVLVSQLTQQSVA